MRLHHVQVSMPPGGEDEARRFYTQALGMVEVDKPPGLAGRGGCWFRMIEGGTVTVEIHLGAEEPFVPSQRAHPALLQESVTELAHLGGADRRRGVRGVLGRTGQFRRICAVPRPGWLREPDRGARRAGVDAGRASAGALVLGASA